MKLLRLLQRAGQLHRNKQLFDLFKAFAFVVVIYLLSTGFDLAERFTAWASPLDSYELDELPVLFMALAIASIWFSHRRMREIKNEIRLRVESELALEILAKENQALARHVMQVQEDERRHIARELHDDMAQYLTAIRLDASSLINTADSKVITHGQRIISHAAHIQKTMKDLLHRLRHAALDTHGLIEALTALIHEWKSQHTDIQCESALHESCQNLPLATKIVIYRVVQEALTNIARHAQAAHVKIDLSLNNDTSVHLQISDDGIGFDKPSLRYGFGLTGMRERIEGAGGKLEVSNKNGLQIRVNLPL